MKIEAFVLCDAATNQQGKLNVLGAFDTVYAQKVPTVFQSCSIALRIRFQEIESGSHSIACTVADADGKLIMPKIEGNLNVKFSAESHSSALNLIFNIQKLKLERFGEYTIDLAVGARQEASIPLYVKELPNPNPETGQRGGQ